MLSLRLSLLAFCVRKRERSNQQRNCFRRSLVRGAQSLEPRLPLNAAPTAHDDLAMTTADTPVQIGYLLLNDVDPDEDLLNILGTDAPAHGSLASGEGGVLTYTPNPNFVGTDNFRYTISDGAGGTDVATVSITVSRQIDAEAARDQILSGVSTIHSGVQPGRMIAYGPQSHVVATFSSGMSNDPLITVAGLGNGRVIAVPDHQMLNMGWHGAKGDTGTFYRNGLAWLAETSSHGIGIVTFEQSTADWLLASGYEGATVATASTLASSLENASIFVGWIGSNQSQENLDALNTFALRGGGLFIAEYGIGYDWWWKKTRSEAPGNRLLRSAGIGFTSGHRWDTDLLDATGQPTAPFRADDLMKAIEEPTDLAEERVDQAVMLMNGLFDVLPPNDSLLAQLEAVYEDRINQINPTPASPVTDKFDMAMLRREMDLLGALPAEQITAHRTAEDVYGEIPDDADRVTRTVAIDMNVSGWHSTGMYAAPGEAVTVTVPASLVGKGFAVRISGHKDDISRRDAWLRVPYGVHRVFSIDAASIKAAAPLGGTVYIDIGDTPAGLGEVPIVIADAIEAPMFRLGTTTDTEWLQSIRHLPAPYAELVSDRVAISVPSLWIRGLSNPSELMRYWDDVVKRQDYVAAHEHLRTGPERINVDVQISAGLLHAGYPIQGPTHASAALVDHALLSSEGNWGYFHELGHQMQQRPDRAGNYYTFSGDGEVTVNIFANAALEHLVSGRPSSYWGYSVDPVEVMQAAKATVGDAAAPRVDQKDPYPFYFQLADEFGWDTYRSVFATYHDDLLNSPDALPQNNQERKDQWLIRWSRVSGFDMVSYMADHWGLEVSASAIDTVRSLGLPDWMPILGADDTISVDPAHEITFNVLENDLTLDDSASIVWFSTVDTGSLDYRGNGMFSYTAEAGPLSHATFEYLVGNATGQVEAYTVTINPSLPFAWWKLDEGQGKTVADSGKSGSVGQVSGAAWVDGISGKALQFNGVDDQLTFGTGPSLSGKTDFTVSAWIRTSATSAGIIIQQRDAKFNGEYRFTTLPDGTLGIFVFGNGAHQYRMYTEASINDGQWHHVAAVRSGGDGFIYIDGSVAAEATGTVRDLDPSIGVAVGADIRDSLDYFQGTIDDVRIYDFAIDADEMKRLASMTVELPVTEELVLAGIEHVLVPDYGPFGDPSASARWSLTATLADGSPLPAWLSFYPASGIFEVGATEQDVGAFDVEIRIGDLTSDTISGTGRISLTVVTNPIPWQNSAVHADVNQDGAVTALDALFVINRLNRHPSGELEVPRGLRAPAYDVDGDGRVSALDALRVINHLNRLTRLSGAASVEQMDASDAILHPLGAAPLSSLLGANTLLGRKGNRDHR